MKIIRIFHLKSGIFPAVKYRSILHGRGNVMYMVGVFFTLLASANLN